MTKNKKEFSWTHESGPIRANIEGSGNKYAWTVSMQSVVSEKSVSIVIARGVSRKVHKALSEMHSAMHDVSSQIVSGMQIIMKAVESKEADVTISDDDIGDTINTSGDH